MLHYKLWSNIVGSEGDVVTIVGSRSPVCGQFHALTLFELLLHLSLDSTVHLIKAVVQDSSATRNHISRLCNLHQMKKALPGIQLLLLVNYTSIAEFGIDRMPQPIVEDLCKLESVSCFECHVHLNTHTHTHNTLSL